DVIAAMVGAECHLAGFGFSTRDTIDRMLDAVGDGVAHQVDEWVRNLLDDAVVEFGLAAGKVEFNLFSSGFRSITNSARKARSESSDGHHASGGEFILKVMSELCELVDVAFDAADESGEL